MMSDENLLREVRTRAIGMGFSARWLILELANRYEKALEPEMLRIFPARGSGKGWVLFKRAEDMIIKEFAKQVEEALLNKKLLCRDDIPVIIKALVKERIRDNGECK